MALLKLKLDLGEQRIAPPAEIQGILLVFMAKPLKEAFNLMPLKKNLLPPAEAILGCPQSAIFIDLRYAQFWTGEGLRFFRKTPKRRTLQTT